MTDNTTPNEEPVVVAAGAVSDDRGIVAEGGIAVQGTTPCWSPASPTWMPRRSPTTRCATRRRKRAIDIQGVLVVDADYQGKIKVRKLTDHHTRKGLAWGAVAGRRAGDHLPADPAGRRRAGRYRRCRGWQDRQPEDQVGHRQGAGGRHHAGHVRIIAVVDITAIDAVKQTIPDAAEVKTVPVDAETATAVTKAATEAKAESTSA